MTAIYKIKVGLYMRIYTGSYVPHYCKKSLLLEISEKKESWVIPVFSSGVMVSGLSASLQQFGLVFIYARTSLILYMYICIWDL